MSFNTCIRVGGEGPAGRYIGGGRDTSGPTVGQSVSSKGMIAPHGWPE
jgi:hypothetical protein